MSNNYLIFHCLDQLAHGNGQLTLDCFYGQVEEGGDVLVFQSVLLNKLEDELAARGQAPDGGIQFFDGLGVDQQGLGVGVELDIFMAALGNIHCMGGSIAEIIQ